MRVCHIIEAMGGGGGRVVLNLARAGMDAGDDVTVIYSPFRSEPGFVSELRSMGPRVIALESPMRREVGAHDFLDLLKLYKLLRGLPLFDVIHGHSSKAGALARIAGIFLPRTAMVYTPHAFMTMAPNASPVYGWIERGLSWFCDAVVCVSEQEKKHALDKLKISERKLRVIFNGVSLDYSADRKTARKRIGFEDYEYVIGFVGRFMEPKNPVRAVEAFSIAAKERADLRLVIVGYGELLDQIEKSISAAGLADRVHFMGNVPARDIMPGFDCLVCSSDSESFGLVFVEALDAGVPIVSTPVGIALKAIISGKTGFMTDFDPCNMAKEMLKISELNPEKRLKMSER
ncbi:MAG: glycosyltransferase, partial [Alphaproteobacteria bacterium]|nr:glycosyltransferase [Alphaproteobacteria bacterium]